jgi:hypothetical protein
VSRYVFGMYDGRVGSGWEIDADSDDEAAREAERIYIRDGGLRGELIKCDDETDGDPR